MPKKERFVKVMVDNLGPNLYQKGQIVSEADDPGLFRLLDDRRGKGLIKEVPPPKSEKKE